MCVSSKPGFCLLCLLLYGWQANSEEPHITDSHTASENGELYFMEQGYFLNKLMTKYGNGEEMSYEGFEHLLQHLGLGGTIKFDHNVSCHRHGNSSEFQEIHLNHNHSLDAHSSLKHCGQTDGHYEHDHSHTHSLDEHSHGHGSHDEHSDEHDDHDHDGPDHIHSHDDHEHMDTAGDNDHDKTEHDNHNHDDIDSADSQDHIHNHDENEHTHDNHNHTHNEHTEENNKHSDSNKTVEVDHDHEHDDHHHDHSDHGHLPLEKESNVSKGHTENDQIKTDGEVTEHEHNETVNAIDHKENTEGDGDKNDEHDHDHVHEHHNHKRDTADNECLSTNVMLRLVNIDKPRSLTKDMFKELCPSLIYQIDADTCHSFHTNHNHQFGEHDSHHSDEHDHDHDEHDHSAHAEGAAIDLSKVPPKVWGFSSIAVIIISLVGLLGVAVIPIMQKVFYNHMLQFLVALAVGALSGDALLHLLPHAISGGHGDEDGGHDHSSGSHSHDTGPIYKGLCGLLGIYFFFFTERCLTIFTEYKRKRKHTKNHKKYMRDEESEKVGEKLANSECDEMMMSIHPNKALKGYAAEAHKEHCTISFDNTTTISHEHGQRSENHTETCVDGDENTSMIGSNNSIPKPHGHGHGHSHGVVPDSVASVAWMVILGDGIHNFSDGLAIGAAFVNSITGGFSTSIAVFCHELPHEIGDFAMLLRAGMSPKQAIIYNCLSSILCFVGMLIGVAIGNLAGASLWIFAMVGGMFLYIALVDMLPELSSVDTKKGEHPLFHLLLQGIGMCIGAGIMLAIALYEEDLKTILE